MPPDKTQRLSMPAKDHRSADNNSIITIQVLSLPAPAHIHGLSGFDQFFSNRVCHLTRGTGISGISYKDVAHFDSVLPKEFGKEAVKRMDGIHFAGIHEDAFALHGLDSRFMSCPGGFT